MINIQKHPACPPHPPQMLVVKTGEVMTLEWHYVEPDEFELKDASGIVLRYKRTEVEDFEG